MLMLYACPSPNAHCSSEKMSLFDQHGVDVDMPVYWALRVWHSVIPPLKNPSYAPQF